MTTDQTLSDSAPSAAGSHGPESLDQPLTMDELLNEARRVERVARICLRGDLYAEHLATAQELAGLVDADGKILSDGDQALSDKSRAEELVQRLADLEMQMKSSTRTVRFRAMPDDEWSDFRKEHTDDAGKPKDMTGFNRVLIARCAIAPTFTEDQVDQIRGKLGSPQFTALANEAYWACTTGGTQVPSSPTYAVSGRG